MRAIMLIARATREGGNGRSRSPRSAGGQSGGVTEGLKGTVREIRQYHGFIASHETNESLFFHKNDVVGQPVVVGDRVTFTKSPDTSAKHAGKFRATNITVEV
jgi:cold shock CspA family protein